MDEEHKGINYGAIAEALRFYVEEHDFVYIDLPWVVSTKACDLTRPDKAPPIRISHLRGETVASGEQSFIALAMAGKLKPGKYVGVTPCFRAEKSLSDTRLPYFFKVELFILGGDDISQTLLPAQEFFDKYLDDGTEVIEVSDSQSDLYFMGLELGSYSKYNKKPIGKWVCGTGCAEPRFSIS